MPGQASRILSPSSGTVYPSFSASPGFAVRANAQRTSGSSAIADDPMTRLERLSGLREKGVLSEKEFEKARQQIVNELTGELEPPGG